MTASPDDRRVERLLVAGMVIALLLPVITVAPNRLLSGSGIELHALLHGERLWLLFPLLWLLIAPFLPRSWPAGAAMAAIALGNGLLWLTGQEAALRTVGDDSLVRVSFGPGFWLLLLCLGLLLKHLASRMRARHAMGLVLLVSALSPALVMLWKGMLDPLSLMQEFFNVQDTLLQATREHLMLVAGSAVPAICLGAGFGFVAYKRPRLQGWVLAGFNVLQTIPSIAMFGLLIGPMAALGHWLPQSGIAGIGMAPALVALALYSLLPMTHATLAALNQVPAAARQAGRGLGMTPVQLLLRVELPLALPVFIAGIRITVVQTVGLAAVAALIGAGGFGAILFQGLAASAPDQVILGVLPIVLLTITLDSLFQLLISTLDAHHDRT